MAAIGKTLVEEFFEMLGNSVASARIAKRNDLRIIQGDVQVLDPLTPLRPAREEQADL